MTVLGLRDYQKEDLAKLNVQRATTKRNAMVLPTGMGKTVMMAHDILTEQPKQPGKEIILVHRDELAQQTLKKLNDIGVRNVGLVMAESDERDADVIVASVQTLSRDRRLSRFEPWSVGHITTDECHHSAADSYLRIYNYFGGLNNNGIPMTGWTATLDRNDGKALGLVWQAIAAHRDILYGIENGYLRDPYGIAVHIDGLDLATVARSRGDYQDSSLGEAMELAGAGPVIADAYLEHAKCDDAPVLLRARHGRRGPDETVGYRQAIIFGPSVAFAGYMTAEMNNAGIPTALVIGSTPRDERRRIYAAINSGELHCISSVGVLTEGFDLPPISCAIMARPTLSAGLYTQMAGRVLRPDLRPGKHRIDRALILDAVGNSYSHKLATLAVLTGMKVKPNEGETLAEAAFRANEEDKEQRAGRERKPTGVRMEGDYGWETVDLFHRSHSAWLQTEKEVWFIPAGKMMWWLWEEKEPGDDGTPLYRVGCSSSSTTRDGQWTHRNLPLDLAMSWAEQEANEFDPSVANRKAPWRRKKEQPSDAQVGFAERLRIRDAKLMTKAELSDAISIKVASRLLDRHVK